MQISVKYVSSTHHLMDRHSCWPLWGACQSVSSRWDSPLLSRFRPENQNANFPHGPITSQAGYVTFHSCHRSHYTSSSFQWVPLSLSERTGRRYREPRCSVLCCCGAVAGEKGCGGAFENPRCFMTLGGAHCAGCHVSVFGCESCLLPGVLGNKLTSVLRRSTVTAL